MNVIISNRYKEMLDTLPIDIIKNNNGEYEVEEIIKEFQNYFYQRMILDITAIKNYQDITNLQKLSINLDMDKIILVLDDLPQNMTPDYLSKLISMGIYNFTKTVEGIMYLYNNPNSYRDVAQYHQLNSIIEPTSSVVPGIVPTPTVQVEYVKQNTGPFIIGVKNITKQSGATTFIYMMKKQLEKNYSVVALEINKEDFKFFRDKDMLSIPTDSLASNVTKYNNKEVILVDLNNDVNAEASVNEVIYLIEPSIIKLNKLTLIDPNIFNKYKGKKVLLNQSMLTSKDVLDFEYESRLKIFFNMPPLEEREKNIQIMNIFLTKLGFVKQKTE